MVNNYAIRNALCFQRSINILCKQLSTNLTVIEVTALRVCVELEDTGKQVNRFQIARILKKIDLSMHKITLHLVVNRLVDKGYISPLNEYQPCNYIYYSVNDTTRSFFNKLEKQLRKQRIMY